MLTASIITPWAPVGTKLAVVVLHWGDDVLILGSRALHKKLSIDTMVRLKAMALESAVVSKKVTASKKLCW